MYIYIVLGVYDLAVVLEVIRRNKLPDTVWELLGVKLGLYEQGSLSEIKRISSLNNEAKSCMEKCLTAWLEWKDGVVKSGIPSWYTLAKAVAAIDEDIAKNIRTG